MKKLLIILFFSGSAVFAQNQADTSGAYMVPPAVYVGDRASLILAMPGNTSREDIAIIHPSLNSEIIEIHRISLEQRPVGSRLIVEFSAYEPGTFELPALEIGGMLFSGLKIEIISILEKSETGYVLSGPALPMPIPGTAVLIYGTIFAIILILLSSLWLIFRGRLHIAKWMAAWKRRRLLASMRNIEKHLRKDLAKGANRRHILDTLSAEFRSFISWFSGENCRAMTAAEFYRFARPEKIPLPAANTILGDFYSRCDSIRFNGREIGEDETAAMLDAVKGFLANLDNSMKRKAA